MMKLLSIIFFVAFASAQFDETNENKKTCPEIRYEIIAGRTLKAGAIYCSAGTYYMNCRIAMNNGWVGMYIHANVSYEPFPEKYNVPGAYLHHFDIPDQTTTLQFSFPLPDPTPEESCQPKTIYFLLHMDTRGPGGTETAYAKADLITANHIDFPGNDGPGRWGWVVEHVIGCDCYPQDPPDETPPVANEEECCECAEPGTCGVVTNYRLFCGTDNTIAGTGIVSFDSEGCVVLSISLTDQNANVTNTEAHISDTSVLSTDGPYEYVITPGFSTKGFANKHLCPVGGNYQKKQCGQKINIAAKVSAYNIVHADGTLRSDQCFLGDVDGTSITGSTANSLKWSPGRTLKDIARCCPESGTEPVASSSVSVSSGCTYTIGYWKNHNSDAKNPNQNKPWPLVRGESETITCGKNWLDILNTPSGGDAWLIMAKQYIGASLNVAGGASPTPEVAAALPLAKAALEGNCNGVSSEDRAQFIDWGRLFDRFNNGIIGPGHCGDGSTIDPCPCRCVVPGGSSTIGTTDETSMTLKSGDEDTTSKGKGGGRKRFLEDHAPAMEVKYVRSTGIVSVEVTILSTMVSSVLAVDSSFLLDSHSDARITVSGTGSATFFYCRVGEACVESVIPPGSTILTPGSSATLSSSVFVILFAFVFSLF